jgi:hypothetical protein
MFSTRTVIKLRNLQLTVMRIYIYYEVYNLVVLYSVI